MAYTVENINGCKRKIIFSFNELDLTNEFQTELAEKRKTVSLKGFRKGKAPKDMVEDMYGPQIETDIVNKFVQNKLYETISAEDLRVVGYPAFENMKYEKGQSISFDVTLEVFPEVSLTEFKDFTFTKDKVEVTDQDVEELKNNSVASKAEMVELTDKDSEVKNGLYAVINFEGVKEDGERPDNMKGSDHLLEVGSNSFIPGFEEGVIGMKKGDKKSLDLSFPAEYHVDELKNAKVTFEVELLEIKEKKSPELTDELAKELGYESVDDLVAKGKDNFLKQKERQSQEKLHQEVLEKFIEENKFDVPATMIQQQKDHLKDDLKNNLKSQGFDESMMEEYFDKWAGDLDQKADFQVRSGLILDHLGKKYEVEASDDDFNAKLEETAAGTGMDVEQIKQYYTSNDKIKSNLMYAIKEEKTFEAVLKEITVL
jgi:trigger factor